MEQLSFGNRHFFSIDGFTRKRTAGHDFAGIGTIVVQLFVETFTGGFERFGSFLHRDVFRRGADGDGREMLIARGIFDLQDEPRQSSVLPWTVVYRKVAVAFRHAYPQTVFVPPLNFQPMLIVSG